MTVCTYHPCCGANEEAPHLYGCKLNPELPHGRGDVWQYNEMIHEAGRVFPRVVVELGCHEGASLRTWREHFFPDILIGVEIEDTPAKRAACEGFSVVWGDVHADATIREVHYRLDTRMIDFLFLDADHSYEGMARSFATYGRLVRKGGIIILDDVCNTASSHGIHRLAPELAQTYRTKIIAPARREAFPGEGVLVVYV